MQAGGKQRRPGCGSLMFLGGCVHCCQRSRLPRFLYGGVTDVNEAGWPLVGPSPLASPRPAAWGEHRQCCRKGSSPASVRRDEPLSFSRGAAGKPLTAAGSLRRRPLRSRSSSNFTGRDRDRLNQLTFQWTPRPVCSVCVWRGGVRVADRTPPWETTEEEPKRKRETLVIDNSCC